ncbi:hypothetical protein FDP41_007633 [Naegleria fowleri]|uniref:Prominin n=1 Tax=Naegleria fowleri TaxID=5763 RepID=A0A6A5CE08_NAEFO|nr:uncharacterized protein FDP41_007633 [Naegleria fowleri]KAF0983718.1 hypothetical protein FDP41_007633 [Naegleria fowleri]
MSPILLLQYFLCSTLVACYLFSVQSVEAQLFNNVTFKLGEVKTVRTTWPSTMEDVLDGAIWIEYAIFIGIIAIIPIIIGVLGYFSLSLFCCFRCCGLCGGNKPKEIYTTKDLVIPTILVLLVYGGFLTLAGVGIGFSAQASSDVRTMITATLKFMTAANTTIMGIANIGDAITSKFSQVPDKLTPLLDQAIQQTAPLDTISSMIAQTHQQFSQFNSITVPDISLRISNINSNLTVLQSQFNGLPTLSEVPDISPAVQTCLSNLATANTTVANAKSTVISSIQSVKSIINSTLVDNLTPIVGPTFAGVKTQITSIQSQISPYLNDIIIGQATQYTSIAENVRIALSVVFFAWCCFIYVFVFLGLIFRKSCCIQTTSWLAFITAWVFYLFAVIQIPLYLIITDACVKGPTTLGMLGDGLLGQLNAGSGFKLQNVSLMIKGIASCSTNDSLVSVLLGNDYLKGLGIDSTLSGVTGSFANSISSMNISSYTSSVDSVIASANTGSIKTDHTSDLASVRSKLLGATTSLSSLDGFQGFNYSTYNQALTDFNTFTQQQTGRTYTYENFETFDPSTLSSPYNTQGQNLKNALTTQKNKYASALADVTKFNNSVRAITNNLDGLQQDFSLASNGIVQSLTTLAQNVATQIQTMTSNIQTYINNFPNTSLTFIMNLASQLINDFAVEFVPCGFLGSFISTVDRSVCKGLNFQLVVTGAVCFAIGVLMHIGGFITIVLTKRIRYQGSKRINPTVQD